MAYGIADNAPLAIEAVPVIGILIANRDPVR